MYRVCFQVTIRTMEGKGHEKSKIWEIKKNLSKSFSKHFCKFTDTVYSKPICTPHVACAHLILLTDAHWKKMVHVHKHILFFVLFKQKLFVCVCVCVCTVRTESWCPLVVLFLMIMLHEMHLVGSGSINYMDFQNVTLCNPLFICFLHFTSF